MNQYDAVRALGRKLVALRRGTCTAQGTTATHVDTVRHEGDDFWNGGTILNITNTEWGRISDYVKSTGTITHSTLTQSEADDVYELILGKFPLETLTESINTALQELKIPTEDSTSLDTAASTTEYDLPTGINKRTLRQVYIRRDTTGNVDYDWQKLHNWYTRPKGIGSLEVLVLGKQPESGRDLRFVYTMNHPVLTASTGNISEYIPLEKWLPKAALYAMESRFNFSSGNKHEERMVKRFEKEVDEARGVIIPLPPVSGRIKVAW